MPWVPARLEDRGAGRDRHGRAVDGDLHLLRRRARGGGPGRRGAGRLAGEDGRVRRPCRGPSARLTRAPPAGAGPLRDARRWPSGRGRRSRRPAAPGRGRRAGPARRPACPVAAPRSAAPAAPPGGPCPRGTGRTGRRTRPGRTAAMRRRMSRMSVVSSNTTTAPAPRVAPSSFACLERERHVERLRARRTTPAAPPRFTALIARPPGTPPASSIRSRSVIPNSAS